MKRILLLSILPVLLLNLPAKAQQICRTSPKKTPDVSNPIRRNTQSSLQWQHCPAGLGGRDCARGKLKRLSFTQAQDYVFEANRERLEGHDDWRLPAIKELETLKSPDCVAPAIDLRRFPNTPALWFWSSSSNNQGSAWYLDFESGLADQDDRSLANAVRLVRDVRRTSGPESR